MKQKNKERLQQGKNRICRRIGILQNEEPTLILDRKEMRSLVYGRVTDSKRLAGWGQCFYPIRTIFVDCSKTLEYKKDRYGNFVRKMSHIDPKTGSLVSRYVKQKRTYRSFLEVLVHELVHYRFAYLGHGKKFEQRVQEVLWGRIFEPKHVHLFSHMPKGYRQWIDDNPIIEITAEKEV